MAAPTVEGTQIPVMNSSPEFFANHDVADWELDALCETRSDLSFEMLLLAAGALISSLPSAAKYYLGIWSAAGPNASANTVDINLFIFWIALVVTIVLIVVVSRRKNSSTALRDEIRSRTLERLGITHAELKAGKRNSA